MKQIREVHDHDMRAEVIALYWHDVVALVETWLKASYRWFGRNRRSLHRKAVRESGGIGLLVRAEVLEKHAMDIDQ